MCGHWSNQRIKCVDIGLNQWSELGVNGGWYIIDEQVAIPEISLSLSTYSTAVVKQMQLRNQNSPLAFCTCLFFFQVGVKTYDENQQNVLTGKLCFNGAGTRSA